MARGGATPTTKPAPRTKPKVKTETKSKQTSDDTKSRMEEKIHTLLMAYMLKRRPEDLYCSESDSDLEPHEDSESDWAYYSEPDRCRRQSDSEYSDSPPGDFF